MINSEKTAKNTNITVAPSEFKNAWSKTILRKLSAPLKIIVGSAAKGFHE
jgi:hypothetical protein